MCNIIFEDNQVLVAVKPQNVPVQLDSSKDKDFLTEIKEYLKKKYNKKGNAFVGLVHRLDRPTGGVMVFAKTSKSASRLCKDLKEGRIEKTYLAIVDGIPRYRWHRLVNFIKKDEKNNIVRICPQSEEGAKKAILDYHILEIVNSKALLKINLVTGRSHQIRIQMANIGTPVCFDQKYGKGEIKGNLALWASEIKFAHPVSKKMYTFKVEPPKESLWNDFHIDKLFMNP